MKLLRILLAVISVNVAVYAMPAHARVLAEHASPCVVCHGEQGRATPDGFFPRIAGKPADYLFNQLSGFQQGRRHYDPMRHLIRNVDDAFLRGLAEYFAGLDLPYPAPQQSTTAAAELKRGEQLVRSGEPARDIPACVACHGESLMGDGRSVPPLLGLPRDYLNAQFGAWRNGTRRTAQPDCMHTIANRLTVEQVGAAAQWLSAQVVPISAQSAVAPPPIAQRPMRCAQPGNAAGNEASARSGSGAIRDENVPPDRPSARHGAYLARIGNCIGCHTRPGAPLLSGGPAIKTPFGSVYAPNLTPDRATGIGAWQAADFWQAMHQGISRDGRALYPAFPYSNFTLMTRADSDALFAYLQTLPATVNRVPDNSLSFPFNTRAALALWRWLFFKPGQQVAEPAQSAQWNRGAYLVEGLGHCGACHGRRNWFGAVRNAARFAGEIMPGEQWHAPSLLSRAAGGMQAMSTAQITDFLAGKVQPSLAASGPMAQVVRDSTQYLSRADQQAMAAYLKNLPDLTPVTTAPIETVDNAAIRASMQRGAALYTSHCKSCHGGDGSGRADRVAEAMGELPRQWQYPSLSGNRAVTQSHVANLVSMVSRGGYPAVTAANPQPLGMPPFAQQLNDQQIADVLTYIRNAWGSAAPAVSATDVARHR